MGVVVEISVCVPLFSVYPHSYLSMQPGGCSVQKIKPVVFYNLLSKSMFGSTEFRLL